MPPPEPDYAELHARSHFSFLSGASSPEELIEQARSLGYAALAITDDCSVAGAVRAHVEAERLQFKLIIGADIRLSRPSPSTAGALPATWLSLTEPPSPSPSTSIRPQPLVSAAHPSTPASTPTPSANPSAAHLRLRSKVARGANAGNGQTSAAAFVAASDAAACAATTQPGAVPRAAARAAPVVPPEPRVVLLAQSRRGYGNLVRWITIARRRAPKGEYVALRGDVEGKLSTAPMLAGLPGCVALLVPDGAQPFKVVHEHAMWLKTWFGADRAFLSVQLQSGPRDAALVRTVERVAALTGLQVVASGGVLMHARSRKALLDVLTATRLKKPVADCGAALQPNADAHLRPRGRLAALYRPQWLAASVQVAAACNFSLAELRYEYPREIVPEGHTPASWLRQITERGLRWRFPGGAAPDVRAMLEHELALIAQLAYEPYFLTVADIVEWARGQGILCQGRGSAANSLVCYCLGVTEVDPGRLVMLFERFISAERNEPPDIDIDFEHQRREEVIQYIYRKYGRHRAALTGVVISYRPRSALRDVGRALGIDLARIDAVSKSQHWFDGRRVQPERLRENGFDPEAPLCRLWMELTQALIGFPRHLSQHPGGFVIARDDLAQLVPVENAAMDGRSVIQWDKDDLDALKLLKVDILALGMLSALRRALALIAAKQGAAEFRMQDMPAEDPATYDMLCRADSVGTFQVESRAQMSMLPRLQPRKFYDLVIEVAIVRPGPIQGGMVHPYLRRRSGEETADYPSREVEAVLQRTLGVPIFQEQVMQLAIAAADFTPGEADQLRRAMAAWKRKGGLGPFHERLVGRMVDKGYERDYAERIFKQIEGFGEYGFPESHAASFALLVYASAWIKCHHPDAFLAALLNSQPMGFYAPAQLVRDAREHGVVVLPVDVLRSVWDTQLEGTRGAPVADDRGRQVLPRDGSRVQPRGGDEAARQDPYLLADGVVTLAPHARAKAPSTQDGSQVPLHEGSPAPLHAHGRTALIDASGSAPLHDVRLGFSRIAGFTQAAAERIVAARTEAPFASPEDLARRAGLDASHLQLLARADALQSLSGHRHQAAWAVAGVDTRATPMLHATRTFEASASLPAPSAADTTLADYRATGLTLGQHPLALLRPQLAAFKVQPAAVLHGYPNGRLARASGIVTHRQRPETANGVVFVTLEDETGAVNVIVWRSVVEAQRRPLLASSLLTVYGIWQCQGEVRHLVAKTLVDHTGLLRGLTTTSRDFR